MTVLKNISLLGATGSIGVQTLNIIKNNPKHFRLIACAAGYNIPKVREIVHVFQPRIVSVAQKEDAEKLTREFSQTRFVYGNEGLRIVAAESGADILLNAVIGSVGLLPTLEAIRARIPIAIANKETLVAAGDIVMNEAKKYEVPILPVDSEHSALFQALNGEDDKMIDRLILTASGGSFRDKTREQLVGVSVEEALDHPNWSMGSKLTIDSATMMNKGLEVIEAHHLFDMPFDRIECVMHRESIVHSVVEFQDTSMIAQLGAPDMRVPIQYALTYPQRLPMKEPQKLRLSELGQLHFEPIDFDRFRALQLAYDAGKLGGTLPTVMNAANEVAVQLFMDGHIDFLTIDEVVERAMLQHKPIATPDLETILAVDQMTRQQVLVTVKGS